MASKDPYDLYQEYNLPAETFLDIDSLEPTIQSEPTYSIRKQSSICKKSRKSLERKDFG
jgi:hypothetical protein